MSSERTPFASKKARNFLSSGCVQPVFVCVELMQLFSHSPLRPHTRTGLNKSRVAETVSAGVAHGLSWPLAASTPLSS